MTRQEVIDIVHELLGFGHVTTSQVSDNTSTVELTLDGAGEGGSAEASAVDEELWTQGPLMFRPQDEDATGHCEVLFYRLGDGKIVIASKDRRYQISIEKGEAILSAMGPVGRAYVHLKPDGSIILNGLTLNLGGDATNYVALANLVQTQLSALKTAISAAAVVANDGGAALKANILAALTTWPGSVAATKTKAK